MIVVTVVLGVLLAIAHVTRARPAPPPCPILAALGHSRPVCDPGRSARAYMWRQAAGMTYARYTAPPTPPPPQSTPPPASAEECPDFLPDFTALPEFRREEVPVVALAGSEGDDL